MDFKTGYYKHKKGNVYFAPGTAIDASNDTALNGRVMVRYWRTDDPERVYVRALTEFTETVDWPDGSKGPRFQLIEPKA